MQDERSLDGDFRGGSARPLGFQARSGSRIGLLQGRNFACEGEAGRARACDPAPSRAQVPRRCQRGEAFGELEGGQRPRSVGAIAFPSDPLRRIHSIRAEAARERAGRAFQKRRELIVGGQGQGSYRRGTRTGSLRARHLGGDARRDLSLRGIVQRGCHRNRSKRHWSDIGRLFTRLRKSEGKKDALERLANIEVFLRDKNDEALKSLKEAGGELIAFFALEVTSSLNRSLLSTNAIENAFLNLRRHIGRVCRLRTNTDQADRWVASGLFLSEKTFHRIPGCDDMNKLEAALTNSSKLPHGGASKTGNRLEPSPELINQ
ncbi:MAG: hypothetical protein ACI92G_002879 [Candidatus Pelagisphaera sp.]|jgi:hypothetical protein